MHYNNTPGKGPQHIVLVHGNSQSARTWEGLIATGLLSQYHVTAVDLPGHGHAKPSVQAADDYSLKGLGTALAAFLNEFIAGEYILAGVSLGCNIIGEMAGFSAQCKGVFMLGPQIIGGAIGVGDIVQPNPNINAIFTAQPGDAELELFLDDISLQLSPAQRQTAKTDFLTTDPAFRQYFAACIGAQEWGNEIQYLKAANLPLAIVYGAQEKLVNTHYLDNADLNKWRNEIILIPDAGHFAHLDKPTEVAGLLKEFAMECFR